MAKSPSHKWGQILGDFLEYLIENRLREFADRHQLYLDRQGRRPARKGTKVRWVDSYGNAHDLDYVLERNGSDQIMGDPVAFIESAWRRYTKHSRNKAQEIQGAIMPLVATHKNYAPFTGVVIAGEFTSGAITQLQSLGFKVLHFSYDQIVRAFGDFGINAGYEENTPVEDFLDKIDQWEKLPREQIDALGAHLMGLNGGEVDAFLASLEKSVTRFIVRVKITPLHGRIVDLPTVAEAISFIENYPGPDGNLPVLKYEIGITYNNGDEIEGVFQDRGEAIEYLESYRGPAPGK